MMKLNHSLVSLILSLSAGAAIASDDEEIVPIGATTVFVPSGFDNNDDALVVLDGYLPGGCYRLVDPVVEVNLDASRINVRPQAKVKPQAMCTLALVPYQVTAKIGRLPIGKFEIVIGGQVRESLNIAKSDTPAMDNYLYAPIERVWVERRAEGKYIAVLEGRFTDSCWRWSEVKVIRTAKNIELLPVSEIAGTGCEPTERAFHREVELPADLKAGRYLLHVRSLNGQALNIVFPVYADNLVPRI